MADDSDSEREQAERIKKEIAKCEMEYRTANTDLKAKFHTNEMPIALEKRNRLATRLKQLGVQEVDGVKLD